MVRVAFLPLLAAAGLHRTYGFVQGSEIGPIARTSVGVFVIAHLHVHPAVHFAMVQWPDFKRDCRAGNLRRPASQYHTASV